MAADKMQLEELAQLVKDMEGYTSTMEKNLRDCNTTVQTFNSDDGVWDGRSAAQFQNQFEELSNEIGPLVATANAAAAALAKATGAFAAADESLKGSGGGGAGGAAGGAPSAHVTMMAK